MSTRHRRKVFQRRHVFKSKYMETRLHPKIRVRRHDELVIRTLFSVPAYTNIAMAATTPQPSDVASGTTTTLASSRTSCVSISDAPNVSPSKHQMTSSYK